MSNITTNHAATYTNLPLITRTMLHAPDKTCSLCLYFFQFNLNTVSNTVYISDFEVFMLRAPTVHPISGYLLRTAHNSNLIFDFPWGFELSGVNCIGIWDPRSTDRESSIQNPVSVIQNVGQSAFKVKWPGTNQDEWPTTKTHTPEHRKYERKKFLRKWALFSTVA